MLSKIYRALKFYWRADTMYKIHSPFLYPMLESIIDSKKNYYHFDNVEGYRARYLIDTTSIKRTDYGTGGHTKNDNIRISKLAQKSLSSPRQCQEIYRLVSYSKPNTILELGASLGISAAYISLAAPYAKMISLEGDPILVQLANLLKANLNINNLEIIEGDFKNTLLPTLQTLKPLDFIFLDGNHTYEHTLEYFLTLLPFLSESTVVVVDDIHWSHGMERAWNKIRNHDSVSASIDMWDYGIIIFHSSLISPIHHTLISTFLKPWQILLGI